MKITVNRKKDFILIISVLLLAVALLGIQKAYGSSGNTVTDGYCMEQGHISHSHQTLVCLPHKLVVEISNASENETSEEIDIVSN